MSDLADVVADRDRWIRLFNRLDSAVNHHKKGRIGLVFADEADVSLYAAQARILRDAALPAHEPDDGADDAEDHEDGEQVVVGDVGDHGQPPCGQCVAMRDAIITFASRALLGPTDLADVERLIESLGPP